MARTNVAAEHELVKELGLLAKTSNKTLYASLNEAIKLYLVVAKKGKMPEEVVKLLEALEIMRSLDAVPIPKILLDESLQLAYNCSKEELFKLWYNQGKVVGEFCRTLAPDVDHLRSFIRSIGNFLPLSFFELETNENSVSIVMTGTGYSASSSECTAQALKGFLESYGLSIDDVKVSNSFVKVDAHYAKT